MTYPETVNYLYQRLPMFSRVGASAFKKDLTNINALCEAVGNPQQQFKSVHVGGTNGKGSVSHLLAAVFQQSGYKTGLHTSPHLRDLRERFRVNGSIAPELFVVNFVEKYQNLIAAINPSFFEITVVMAFLWFAENQVDIAVVEVGLGGRLDSTNILMPQLSVITNISLEHTAFLGNTRAKIAAEKAGIIKYRTPVVVGESDTETAPVFREKALQQEAPLYFADRLFAVTRVNEHLYGQRVAVNNKSGKKAVVVDMDLGGDYQLQNLQTALCAMDILRQQGWTLPAGAVKSALANVKRITGLRGRWEVLGREPLIIADVGHNVAGLQRVMDQVHRLAFKQLFIVTGFVRDKNAEAMMRLLPAEAAYFFCQADSPRAMPAGEVKQLADRAGLKGTAWPTVRSAFEAARKRAAKEDAIIISGSTFIVAEILM